MSVSRRGFFQRTLGAVVSAAAAPQVVTSITPLTNVTTRVWGSTGGAVPGTYESQQAFERLMHDALRKGFDHQTAMSLPIELARRMDADGATIEPASPDRS